MRSLAILVGRAGGAHNAIREHGECLAEALREAGRRAEVVELDRFTTDGRIASWDAVLLQYNPFQFGKWGFAPWLPAVLLRERRRRPRPVVAVMVHEPYVPMVSWRWRLMGAWQRAQLLALRAASDAVFVSIEAWTEILGRHLPRRPTFHLPVGSNVPDRRNARAERRRRIGADDETVILATLTTGHPSHLPDRVVIAANAVADRLGRAVLLSLGAGAPPLDGLRPNVDLRMPGFLPADELAAELATADVYLAPFVDGTSTRRSSMMAALQHGVAVVGTDGFLTDGLLRRASDAIRLVPVDRGDRFAIAVADLAVGVEQRHMLGEAGRALYERCFDWPVLARRFNDVLGRSVERWNGR